MSEKPEDALKRAIIKAFDKWGAKNFDNLLSQKGDANDNAWKKAHLEDLFLSKRVFIPGFKRYVTKEVSKNPDYQRKRKTLAKACLVSIMRPSGVTVEELKSELENDIFYSRRQLQRIIRDEYSETFYEVEKQRHDRRFTHYSTVFSPYTSSELEHPYTVMKAQKLMDERIRSRSDLISWMERNVLLQNITPEYLEDFLSFRNECLGLMREMNDDSVLAKTIFKDLKDRYEISPVFHAHLQSVLAVGWFRSRRDETKRALIDDGFPFKYSVKDASRVCRLLTELVSPEDAGLHVMLGGATLLQMGLPDGSLALYRESLKIDELSYRTKGIIHENIAVLHRSVPNPKLMVMEMKEALALYKKSGDRYRVSIALKNLGEAEWILGYQDAARVYFKEAESSVEELNPGEQEGVFRNLSFVAWRLGEKDMEINYLSRWMSVNPESEPDLILEIDKRLSKLLSNQNEKEPKIYSRTT